MPKALRTSDPTPTPAKKAVAKTAKTKAVAKKAPVKKAKKA